jgi:hypothetical protein
MNPKLFCSHYHAIHPSGHVKCLFKIHIASEQTLLLVHTFVDEMIGHKQ